LLFFMAKDNIQGALLQPAFIIYLTILSFMLWRALCYLGSKENSLKILLVIVGSLLFYMTDIFVSLYAIYGNKIFITLIWIIYPPALFFLSLINIRQFKINLFEVKK
jgi:predicted neutral ceramidase superfamily lipid hydrolase